MISSYENALAVRKTILDPAAFIRQCFSQSAKLTIF
jgi:hypothetical protein